jgi:hypothetical protein
MSPRRWAMGKHSLITGAALVFLAVGEPAVNAEKTADGCALLKPTEVQALAGAVKIGAGKASVGPFDDRVCEYQWGSGGNVQSGKSFLNLTVTPIAKAFPGVDAASVLQGLRASVKPGNPNTGPITGVGDGGIYESDAPIRVKTTALIKGNMLIVTFETVNARARKDQVIALLKAVAARL